MSDVTTDGSIANDMLEALRAKHGELLIAKAPSGECVAMRIPTRTQYREVREMLSSEKKRSNAPEQLFRYCVVHPSTEEVEAMLSRRPGLADSFGAHALSFAGLVEVETKKY